MLSVQSPEELKNYKLKLDTHGGKKWMLTRGQEICETMVKNLYNPLNKNKQKFKVALNTTV